MTMQVALKQIPFPVEHSTSFKIEDMFRFTFFKFATLERQLSRRRINHCNYVKGKESLKVFYICSRFSLKIVFSVGDNF